MDPFPEQFTMVRLLRITGWTEKELYETSSETVQLLMQDINAEAEANKDIQRELDSKLNKKRGWF